MNYKVRIKKHIHSGCSGASSNDVWLKKDLVLGFPPFVGLHIDQDNWEAVITEVSYQVDEGWFICYTNPDKQIYDAVAARRQPPLLDAVVQKWLDSGWSKYEGGIENELL